MILKFLWLSQAGRNVLIKKSKGTADSEKPQGEGSNSPLPSCQLTGQNSESWKGFEEWKKEMRQSSSTFNRGRQRTLKKPWGLQVTLEIVGERRGLSLASKI